MKCKRVCFKLDDNFSTILVIVFRAILRAIYTYKKCDLPTYEEQRRKNSPVTHLKHEIIKLEVICELTELTL